MKLARKITLLFLVPFIVLLLLLGYRSVRREISAYKGMAAADLVLTGRGLRPIFTEVWRVGGEARALEVLSKADRELSEIRVRWVPGATVPQANQGDLVVHRETSENGKSRIFASLRVEDEHVPPGSIELSRSLDQETRLIRGAVRDTTLITIGALIAALALGIAVGTWFIGPPIRSLVARTHRIGQGDLSPSPLLHRSDELRDLADAMNNMCDQLATARQMLADETDARLQALEQLRHADRLSTVGKLAAGLAHELGTPLNVVSGRAKMISSGKLAAEAIRENATIIGGQAARMTTIIRGLLDFSRRGATRKGRIDLCEMANTTLRLLAPLSKKRGVLLKLEGAEIPRTLEVDAGQIGQVLTNLVVNAVDATPDGGTVLVRLAEEEAASPPAGHEGKSGPCVRLDVRDEGMGIRKEDLERIFEPFFTTKEVGEGTGLGLSVAHGIVHDHGGWIAVESGPNRGTCFSVYLPKLT